MNFLEALKLRNEPLFYFGLVCLIIAIACLILSKTTNTQFGGTSAWYKPFKFAASIMIYSWTMAWLCYELPNFNTNLFNWTVIILLGFEIVYIALQAAKGQASHFNLTTPLYSILFSIMGIAATLVTLYTAYIGILFFQAELPNLPTSYIYAIRLGIILFVIFSFEGALMGARMTHSVGTIDTNTTIPFLNWSRQIGDLRIAHFIGMHALQILPLLGYYLIKNPKGIIITSTIYFALALFTLIQALNGKPLIK